MFTFLAILGLLLIITGLLFIFSRNQEDPSAPSLGSVKKKKRVYNFPLENKKGAYQSTLSFPIASK